MEQRVRLRGRCYLLRRHGLTGLGMRLRSTAPIHRQPVSIWTQSVQELRQPHNRIVMTLQALLDVPDLLLDLFAPYRIETRISVTSSRIWARGTSRRSSLRLENRNRATHLARMGSRDHT